MKSESRRKSFIKSVSEHLLSLGAKTNGISTKSNSAYFKYGGAHIRVSDHFNPYSRMVNIDIVTAGNDSKSVIMSINSYPMVMSDTKSVKTFLTNFCEFYAAFDFTKACAMNTKIIKLTNRKEEANKMLEKILNEVSEAEKTLKQKTMMIKAADKKIARNAGGDDRMLSSHGISLEGLNNDQITEIARQVLTYKKRNEEKCETIAC